MSVSPFISFIVPYYQVEAYLLRRCLDNLLSLSVPQGMEIVLVDDGTPDSQVPEWLADWHMQERVVYVYQENKGPGGARNTGMKCARGIYIQCVDPDDYILRDAHCVLMELLTRHKPDLLSFYHEEVYDAHPINPAPNCYSVYYCGSGVHFMLHYNVRTAIWGYIFRKSILQNLVFPEHLYHEDEAFTSRLYLAADYVVATDLRAYAYFHRENSIMHDRSVEKLHKRFADLLLVQHDFRQDIARYEGEARRALKRRLDQCCMSMLYKLLSDSPDDNFLNHYMQQMAKESGYPLPLRYYSFRYFLFALTTRTSSGIRFWRAVLK